MGTHVLLLLLGLSMMLGFLHALQCFQCDRVNANGVCESGESFCQTEGSQQCFLRKVYEGDRLLYGYQGCGDLCLSMSFFKQNARVDFVCCSDTSFCNRF
ncbi:PREDICTED: secreted seminal-vesicle Ly-6 protein 1-like [Ceratotherium simum simum]|uniref:Secreted seminal-vesicle Ly-6 protein 1-like n=2 Tax=Rhinocerotidae TaxID=9803 RepID=A0ABM1DBH8_CERSS|nr:PREDICTED: secreted seminal-vesicle Ly-6 protein 1-like [Ceratotherium simum simum]